MYVVWAFTIIHSYIVQYLKEIIFTIFKWIVITTLFILNIKDLQINWKKEKAKKK